MRHALLLLGALAVPLAACDRAAPEEIVDDGDLGTFEASVRQTDGPAFETLEGTATVSASEAGVTVRLRSPLPQGRATTLDLALDLPALPTPGTYALGKQVEDDASLCYRSEIFPGEPYRAESGTLTVVESAPGTLHGELRATGAFDLQTGPATSVRLRIEIEGAFRAEPGEANTSPAEVRRCLPRE